MSQAKKYLINSQRAISETIDGETIIIHLETGSYYSMNPDATALWSALISGSLIPASEKNIADFMKKLADEGLVVEVPESSGASESVANASLFPNPKIEKYEDMQEMLLADPIHDVETAGWPNLKKE